MVISYWLTAVFLIILSWVGKNGRFFSPLHPHVNATTPYAKE
ncbi:MAG: hypothetical protein R3C62_08360 [Chloroflexota bacterium]